MNLLQFEVNYSMATKLVSGLEEVFGCQFLADKGQLLFVERGKGAISLLDFVHPANPIVSSGSTTLVGNGYFDLDPEKRLNKYNADLYWSLIDNVKRQMGPVFGAGIVNLGTKVSFSLLTVDDLQNKVYSDTPIPGNNDPTNQLVNGDVFAVRTRNGNLAKVRVVSYGTDLKIEWITYEPSARYRILRKGWWAANETLNDFAISSDGKTAYVTEDYRRPIEPGTSLLKINLEDPDSKPITIYSIKTMNIPFGGLSEIYLDESRQQVYVIEALSRLLRIDLGSGQMSVVLDRIGLAKDVLVTDDLNYAYISEESSIRRYSLNGSDVIDIATGLNNPYHLTWADKAQSAIFVAEEGSNCVTIVETNPGPGSVRKVIQGVVRPMSVALIDATHMLVCCAKEIYMCDLMANIQPPLTFGLLKGIGRVLTGCINGDGKADTSKYPAYPYRFENVPFGGSLSINISHDLAQNNHYAYYRIRVEKEIRYGILADLQLNPATHKYDIPVTLTPMDFGSGKYGFYPVRGADYGNPDLAMILDSSALPNKKQTITIEFADANGNPGSGKSEYYSESMSILIDNNCCFARIEMPIVNAVQVPLKCGMLKYGTGDQIKIIYYASHPNLFATYSWRVGRAGIGTIPAVGCSVDGDVKLGQFTFGPYDVKNLMGDCTAAAFYAYVYVYAKATNGDYRLSQYDASYTIAFALTP